MKVSNLQLLLWLGASVAVGSSQDADPNNAAFAKASTCASQPGPSGETDLSIRVARLPVGAVLPNAFRGLSSPAATVFTEKYWTDSGSIKYIAATDYKHLIATSSASRSRDMEVDTWSRNGIVLLRLARGKAIYFAHNGETTNGSLQIGIVTNFAEGQGYIYGTSASFVHLYDNENLVQTVTGYSKTETAGGHFTFGVSGFDVYAHYNGIEFLRFKQFSHMARGAAALQANSGYGFRDVTIRLMPDSVLYSSIDCNSLDPRDFGASSLAARGTIAAGSNQLSLVSNPGFTVGDSIIVETGGERGAGQRGTPGVGGAWPARSYANVGAMNADVKQAPDTYAWIKSTGDVWRWSSGAWVQIGDYYLAKAAPKALIAHVTSVVGTVLTLDTAASVDSNSATVYKDNWPAFNLLLGDPGSKALVALLPSKVTVKIPAGSFALSQKLSFSQRVGWIMEGAGVEQTRLFSPRGTRSQCVAITAGHDNVVRNLTLQGNARFQGYMLAMAETGAAPGERMYPPGILFSISDRGLVQNVKVIDVFMDAVGTSYSNDVWAYNCTSAMTDGLQRYVQWMFQWADSNGGGCVDCKVISPILTAGFETFRSNGVTFTRPLGLNAVMASNSSGNFLFDSPNLTIKANSQLSAVSFSANNPIININSNIQPPNGAMSRGGQIRNPTIYEPLPINAQNDALAGIVVNLHNPNVMITGTYPTGNLGTLTLPNWKAPSALHGAVGVNSTGKNTTVSGIRVIGTTDATWDYNISLAGARSICTNSIADRISAATQSGNMTNAAWKSPH